MTRLHDGIRARGYVLCSVGNRQPFIDCGVDLITVPESRTSWVPDWAEALRVRLENTWTLGPVLIRSAVDETFRDAVLAILALQPETAARASVTEYARSQGVITPEDDAEREAYVKQWFVTPLR